jgi:hypothetical protein
MQSTSMQRQIALVSYGTQTLSKGLDLEDWRRHGIFFGCRLLFRLSADNTLLADDFTLWLTVLERTGALRLSLHRIEEFAGDAAPTPRIAGQEEACVVVVHYREHHQLWVKGKELAAWLAHPALAAEPGHGYSVFPDAAYYGGDIDSYWCGADRPGTLAVPDTDWQALSAAIAADLDIAIPSNRNAATPLVIHNANEPPWAAMPLFPNGPSSYQAHRLLADLYRHQGQFANDTHPKNEGNIYLSTDEAGASALRQWGDRLDRWIADVELRCANECRGPVARLSAVQDSHAATLESSLPLEVETPLPTATAEADKVAPAAKWIKRLGALLGFAVLSLMVLAIANIIAGFPWLALLVALLVALVRGQWGNAEKG